MSLPLLRQDLRYALRMMLRTKVTTAIAVVSLGLGIAANVAIFSTLNSWLLRPLPYPEADRLVMLYEQNRNEANDVSAAPANFFDWQAQSTSFDAWMAQDFTTVNLTGTETPLQLTAARSTPNLFAVLGAEPLVGRAFLPDEGGPEDPPLAVLSEILWRDRFASDPAVLGTTIELDGEAHTVVGVMPDTFDFILGSVDLWIADTFEAAREERRERSLLVTARLRDGVDLDRAQAEMLTIATRLEEQYPDTNRHWTVNVNTVREQFPGRTDTGLIHILMVVVLLVLLIACVNVASLLLAKTEARQKEIAIRRALGAGRMRVARQLLTESVLLALLAGILGCALGYQGIGGVRQAIPPEIPSFLMPRFDLTVLLFAVALSVLAGLTFGITPVLQTVGGQRGGRSPLLDASRGGSAGRARRRLRSGFVIAEFALALTILIASAVLNDVFHSRLDINPGFEARGVLTMELTLPEHRYPGERDLADFSRRLGDELAELPGVAAVAQASHLPRSRGLAFAPFTWQGEGVEAGEERRTSWLALSPDYFETLGIVLDAGRHFTITDDADSKPVVMVNERFVERFSPDRDPVGRYVEIRGEEREIVGVASNIAQSRLSGLEEVAPAVYFPLAQEPRRSLRLLLRAQGDPNALATPAQEAVWRLDPDQPIAEIQTLEHFIASQLAGPNLLTQLLFTVGLLTLALAAMGIYGVMAFAVTQQGTEIGIRMAMGARPRQILMRVTRQGLTLAGAGLLLGVPAAGWVVYAISSILSAGAAEIGTVGVGVDIGAGPILEVSGILIVVGLVSALLPARRATQLDPVRVLQNEG